MKKILQKFSLRAEDSFAKKITESASDFISKHPEICSISLLLVACLAFLFWGLNFYPLMDVDETRYAVMARDLINSFNLNSLMLNNVPFLEKPPLYFWLVGLSIKVFGGFSAFAVRFPIALLASFVVFFTYYVGKRVISRKYGLISALILLSSVFFLILSHVAILDMVLTVFVTSAIYCALLTEHCEEKNKKFYWWYFYAFIGLGFLSKGILALAIPVTIVFIYSVFAKNVKELFKPLYLVPGVVIFLLIAAPWHFIMYKEYGYQFVREYFLLHHFARFMNSETIGRERPLLYFVPVFLLGFMPWTLVFLAFLYDSCLKLVAKYKAAEGKVIDKLAKLFETTTKEQRFLLFCAIYFVVIFVLFSSSSTKLPTYILPVFPAAALLTGYFWWVSDEKGEHSGAISITTQIFAAVFVIAAFTASIGYYFLPYVLQVKMSGFKEVTILALFMLAILLVLRLKTKRPISVFAGYVFTMFFVIALAVSQIFNFVYSTGENEIVRYSIMSNYPDKSTQLVTFDFAVKPSVLVEYADYVNFITDEDFDTLDKLLEYRGGPTFVIVKNSNFEKYPEYKKKLEKRLESLQMGEKYSLYVLDVRDEYNNCKKISEFGEYIVEGVDPYCSYNSNKNNKSKSKKHRKHRKNVKHPIDMMYAP